MVLRRHKRWRWPRRRAAANSRRLSTASSMARRWANPSSSDEDPKLPDDVAVEILKRLPAKPLLRFRSVCRSWRSAIDDPRFVALHLSHAALDASNWYLVSIDWCDRLCSLFSKESLALPPRSQIAIPFVAPPDCCMIVGSCDGLICFVEISDHGHGFGRTMYLWNLFTRKHKAVPPSGPEHQFSVMETPHEALGFGFDARSNDYKIVRILYVLDDDGRCFDGMEPRVEIYSLGAHSWRSLACEVPALCQDDAAAFLNGNLHWFASKFGDLGDEEGGHGSIVLFDVAREVFDEMPLPPEEISHADSDALVMSLAVLNDLLAVVIGFIAVDLELHTLCSVWVMRDYGVPQSWTKLYTFKACGVVAGFDGFTRNGELLMELDGGERVSWNPITGQFTNLPLLTEYDLITVVESLVSP